MNYPMPPSGPPELDYPGHRPPRRRGAPWLWLFLAIAVVIIVVLSVIVIAQFTSDDPTPPASAPTQSAPPVQPAPQPSVGAPGPSVAGTSMTCDGYTASVDETSQPGWHATINRFGLAYAAPPDWTVAECGVRTGWAKPCPQGQCVVREIGAVSTVANPVCPKQNLAMAGVTGSANQDITAALDEEAQTVPLIYSQGDVVPDVEFGPVREFLIGSSPAVQRVATVTGIAADECNGSRAFHSMVVTTVPGVEGSVVFLISLREGATASPKPGVIDEMVRTLRSPA
ncbi:hypothetical protein ACEWX3_06195 [Mycobacterium sp. G7A2]|uniref:hypothetical protein n=2 Tax=Mycobacteriaceae TaxID=1762 RepID=UPI0035A86A9C